MIFDGLLSLQIYSFNLSHVMNNLSIDICDCAIKFFNGDLMFFHLRFYCLIKDKDIVCHMFKIPPKFVQIFRVRSCVKENFLNTVSYHLGSYSNTSGLRFKCIFLICICWSTILLKRIWWKRREISFLSISIFFRIFLR